MSQAFPYLNILTIDGYVPSGTMPVPQSAENQEPEDYVDFSVDYEDSYENYDGSYIDDNYNPDLDDWANSTE